MSDFQAKPVSLKTASLILPACLSALLSGCGGGSSSDATTTSSAETITYTVSGTVAGLSSGTSVVLSKNGTENVTVNADGAFAFTSAQYYGDLYHVFLSSNPAGEICSIGNPSYSNITGNVTSIAVNCSPTSAMVSTFAGHTGVFGSADGTGTTASFDNPLDLASDAGGNLYVSDSVNRTVRKIAPDGTVSTFAGSPGVIGSTDGAGAAASFGRPAGLAVDVAGNVYVADIGNQTIRKITPAGVVSTLAGQVGVVGSADGTGTAATFNNPAGVAVDNSGNVYVTDRANSTVRKITPAGAVTTLAGQVGVFGGTDGTGAAASFYAPIGIAADASGNVFVADGANTIRKITPDGTVSTFAGTAGTTGAADGTGSAASFNALGSMKMDGAGNLYVADSGNNVVRKITPNGVVSIVAGTIGQSGSADGNAGAATFNSPAGAAVDSAGNVYVADYASHAIRKIVQ